MRLSNAKVNHLANLIMDYLRGDGEVEFFEDDSDIRLEVSRIIQDELKDDEVIDQAEAIGVGSLDRRIQAYADTREYRGLVDVLNTMLSRIQGAFEAQRRFTADASEAINIAQLVMFSAWSVTCSPT